MRCRATLHSSHWIASRLILRFVHTVDLLVDCGRPVYLRRKMLHGSHTHLGLSCFYLHFLEARSKAQFLFLRQANRKRKQVRKNHDYDFTSASISSARIFARVGTTCSAAAALLRQCSGNSTYYSACWRDHSFSRVTAAMNIRYHGQVSYKP